jgi:hypothetical protein
MRRKPISMFQNKRVFGANQTPGVPSDTLTFAVGYVRLIYVCTFVTSVSCEHFFNPACSARGLPSLVSAFRRFCLCSTCL